jgi:GNAT superfamily N-acetyltransferase
MKIDIRNHITENDPNIIYDIVKDTGFFSEEEALMAKEVVLTALLKPEEYFFFIAESEGKPIGYACYGNVHCSKVSYELYWISVLREFQRHGLGKVLIEAVENAVRQLGGRKLFVCTSGTKLYSSTRNFYEAGGYIKAAVLKDYYNTGDDEVIYEKNLWEQT